MSINVQGTLDTNVEGDSTAVLPLTGETKLAFYVFDKSGAHNNHRIGLEVSPNGTDWVELPRSMTGVGFMMSDILATHIRAKVFESEGAPSEVDIHLLAE